MAITPASRRKPETYSDFHKDLTQSPVNFDLARKIDEESIKESIKNLVMTDRGERLFQPNIGCDVRKMLFENAGADTIVIIKEMIKSTVKTYEPRANLLGVDILASVDELRFTIIITFNVINRAEPITLTVTLDRVK
jgi:phage baseplate assembly protein W